MDKKGLAQIPGILNQGFSKKENKQRTLHELKELCKLNQGDVLPELFMAQVLNWETVKGLIHNKINTIAINAPPNL